MQSDLFGIVLPLLGLLGLFDVLTLYATYLSLAVWRGLAVPIFRSRALWMALFGIPLVVAINYAAITRIVISDQSLLTAPIVSEILFTFPFVTLFAWIDRMVSSVIRLDFLRRDILSWRRLRIAYWALVVFSNLFFFLRYVYGSALILVAEIGLLSLVYGSICLAKGARTTKDIVFRSHVKWFGYLGVAFIPALLLYGLYEVSYPLVVFLPLVAVSYCFYKMARFLVPIGKFSADQG